METIYIAFAVSAVSFTISTTSIFRSIREWISDIHPKLEELIHCPYCLSHYVAILAMLSQLHVSIVSWIIYYFAVIGISGCVHYVLLRAYKPVAENEARRVIENMKKRSKEHD